MHAQGGWGGMTPSVRVLVLLIINGSVAPEQLATAIDSNREWREASSAKSVDGRWHRFGGGGALVWSHETFA